MDWDLQMEKVIKVLNSLVEDEIIQDYAICGGMAYTHYFEPDTTFDLDIFVIFNDESRIEVLRPVYERLKNLGHEIEDEYVIIEGINVQFLPSDPPLLRDSVLNLNVVKYYNTDMKIVSVEYLLAILLQTNRSKDKIRLAAAIGLLKESDITTKLDNQQLQSILERHDLKEKWEDFIENEK
jgi:hypothetical protein